MKNSRLLLNIMIAGAMAVSSAQAALVLQTGSNGTTPSPGEDWNTAADWDGSAPTSGNDYQTASGLALRGGPSSTGAASTFGGGSLEVVEGSLLNLKNWDTASTINGAFTLSGGHLGHLPNSGAGAPFSATFNVTNFTTSGDSDISIGSASRALTIKANLTGSGDLHIGNSENDATDVVRFAGIDSFTGSITIGDHGSSVFGTGWDIEGALTLSLGTTDFTFSDTVTILGSSVLQVNSGQTLTFAEGDLIDPVNGTVTAGTYTTAALGANYAGDGTIVVGSDSRSPTISSLSPADDAMNAWVGGNLVATFNEPVTSGVGFITLKRTADDGTVESFDVASSPRITFNGIQLTIDPTDDLDAESGY